jgi:hypothetical protein
VEQYSSVLEKDTHNKTSRPLPSNYTILQLMKSYTGYNKWMAAAAKDGALVTVSDKDDDDNKNDKLPKDALAVANRAALFMKRGRRHVYGGNYAQASKDFSKTGINCWS